MTDAQRALRASKLQAVRDAFGDEYPALMLSIANAKVAIAIQRHAELRIIREMARLFLGKHVLQFLMVTLEYDCPISGIDFDYEAKYGNVTHPFTCPGCSRQHQAGVDVDVNVLTEKGAFMFAINRTS